MAFILTVTRITTVRRLPPVGLKATQPAWLIKHTKVLKKDEWAQRWLWGVVILSVSRTNLPLPRALFCPSAGGGQTQDGLSIHGGRGDRLWDDLQRLRVQLHAGLRGHTHDEVRVGFNCLQFYSLNVPSLTSFPSNPRRRWEGGDPGVANQKSPTCLLLAPDLRFHSFGFAARDFYHDLDPEEAQHWLYFDKFKMKIHSTSVREIEWKGPEIIMFMI